VELLAPELLAGRGDAKSPALAVVQDGGEDAGGIEVGQAEPVDGSVHPHQRGRAQIADDAVILDRLVARFHRTLLPCCQVDACTTSGRPDRVFSIPMSSLLPPTATIEIRVEE